MRIEAVNEQLKKGFEVGRWELEAGSWEFEVGSWGFEEQKKLEAMR